MQRLLLYEINTRCWLRELSDAAGRQIALGNVPESEFVAWKCAGVSHLWLMGVWTTGGQSRRACLESPGTRRRLDELLPGWNPADVPGSPYAVTSYRVAESLGGDAALKAFRVRLHSHGIRLILDFVPNHVGLDHPWLAERPELFVQSVGEQAGTFRVSSPGGERWIAHGKDPYFPAWIDTAQLDFRYAATRKAVIEDLKSVADQCDGVRCDMAMLLLNDVFARNWQHFPVHEREPTDEFWTQAIAATRREDFLIIAEAYWDLELRLQALGFDYTYDKRVTDFIIEKRWAELQAHLLSRGTDFVRRSIHFLENHDEARIASRLSLADHEIAAAILAVLPGMPLLYEGQLHGTKIQVPVQAGRRPVEVADLVIQALYKRLFKRLDLARPDRRTGCVVKPEAIAPADQGVGSVIAVLWSTFDQKLVLAAVNPLEAPVSFAIDLTSVADDNARRLTAKLVAEEQSTQTPPVIHDGRLMIHCMQKSLQLIDLIPGE